MANYLAKSNQDAVDRVHEAISKFVVRGCLPLSLATSPDLHDIVLAASFVKPGVYSKMTTGKMNTCLLRTFTSFVECIQRMVVRVRLLHNPLTTRIAMYSFYYILRSI